MENNANNGHEAYDDQVIFVDTHLIQKAVEGLQRSREEFQSLLEQAEGGDPAAYYDLGVRYAEGDGAERDPARAAHWFSLAAEDGDLRAVDLLGRCYQAGSGVEKDEARAAECYLQAAEQDYAPAQTNLAVCYFNGIGVDKDVECAHQWLEKAAEQLRVWAFMGMDKTYRRAISMEKRIERMRTTSKPTKARKMDARFSSAEFHGDEVLGIRNVSKSYGDKHLFEGISLKVEGGERIALIGDNGTGKSTLIKMIVGELYPDDGRIKTGPQVKEAYLPQIVRFDHPDWNLVENMMAAKRGLSAQSARNRLAAYDFRGEDVFKPVSALSGGEQSRLRLCMLMDEKINLLILDEPTNHLDIQSREWIEEAVEEYEGNLLFVSHDRYFIDRFASRIWMLEDGHITDFRGNYQEYQAARARGAAGKSASDVQVSVEKAPEPKEKKEKPKRPGGTKNLEKEVTAAERAVAKAEEQMYDLEQQIQEASADYLKLQELYEQREALEEEILKLYGTWETLSAQLEEARG